MPAVEPEASWTPCHSSKVKEVVVIVEVLSSNEKQTKSEMTKRKPANLKSRTEYILEDGIVALHEVFNAESGTTITTEIRVMCNCASLCEFQTTPQPLGQYVRVL
jgi:hypothetical protein